MYELDEHLVDEVSNVNDTNVIDHSSISIDGNDLMSNEDEENDERVIEMNGNLSNHNSSIIDISDEEGLQTNLDSNKYEDRARDFEGFDLSDDDIDNLEEIEGTTSFDEERKTNMEEQSYVRSFNDTDVEENVEQDIKSKGINASVNHDLENVIDVNESESSDLEEVFQNEESAVLSDVEKEGFPRESNANWKQRTLKEEVQRIPTNVMRIEKEVNGKEQSDDHIVQEFEKGVNQEQKQQDEVRGKGNHDFEEGESGISKGEEILDSSIVETNEVDSHKNLSENSTAPTYHLELKCAFPIMVYIADTEFLLVPFDNESVMDLSNLVSLYDDCESIFNAPIEEFFGLIRNNEDLNDYFNFKISEELVLQIPELGGIYITEDNIYSRDITIGDFIKAFEGLSTNSEEGIIPASISLNVTSQTRFITNFNQITELIRSGKGFKDIVNQNDVLQEKVEYSSKRQHFEEPDSQDKEALRQLKRSKISVTNV
ncbi:uncharacterized protein PRCAT00004566001 [Priceomyces carsonii]|uniref:uncharacterized protein n=1 Tax=Priceomyces carsonii TaxID=28549 RepID=UPI002EDA90CC|nr:unnamed protein product [Priceomyces carsonii]